MNYANDRARVMETMIKGWTRVEMLITLYERAIASIEVARDSDAGNDSTLKVRSKIEANKMILGLLSGLDSGNCQIAFNIEQLLVFVMLQLDEGNFETALTYLGRLKDSFVAIKDEAGELESQGIIPPLADANVFDTVA